AMITLAMAQMIFFYFLQAPFTHGEDGLQGIPRGSIFGIDLQNDLNLYYLVMVVFILGFIVCWRTVNSPFGQVLKALRENEPRTISLGFDVARFKLLVFVISATLAGLAGATKSLVFVSATLSDATWQMSGLVILMTLIGGLGTFLGPVLGALIVVVLENKVGEFGHLLTQWTGIGWFRVLGESVTMVIGLIFIICVMAFRRGIIGEILHRYGNRKAAAYAHRCNIRGGPSQGPPFPCVPHANLRAPTTQATAASVTTSVARLTCSFNNAAARPRAMNGCSNCSWLTAAIPPSARPRYQNMKPISMLKSET